MLKLWRELYENTENNSDFSTKYPIGLFKLLIYYEELTIFEALYEEEKNVVQNSSKIIAEIFSYSLMIDNPLLSIFLRNWYPDEIFENSRLVINSIFNNLNKLVESFSNHSWR